MMLLLGLDRDRVMHIRGSLSVEGIVYEIRGDKSRWLWYVKSRNE